MRYALIAASIGTVVLASGVARADGIIEFGDENLLGTGTYGSDPKAGATLNGLAPGATTEATTSFFHGFPFSPGAGTFAGTDQIFVGSTQTGAHDGYSVAAQRINGPQVLTLDYGSLVPGGNTITTLTLGIATDDFQFPSEGQPFTASINGATDAALTALLNSLDDGGPVEHFVTIGIDPVTLLASNVLTLTIDEGGDGGDGWAVDFLTVGVTSEPTGVSVPEPAPIGVFASALLGLGLLRRRMG
jgi:hypothetical protein